MDAEKYFQMAVDQLKEQFKNVDVLNAKINTLLIVCGVFAVFFGSLVSECYYGAGAGLPFIILSMIYLLFSYRVVDWQNAPNVDRITYEVNDSCHETGIINFYKEAIMEISACYAENEEALKQKSNRINKASLLLTIGIIISTVGSVIYLF